MADWIAAHGRHGASYAAQTPESIADAVSICIDEMERLRSNRQEVAAIYRAQNGTYALVDYILAHTRQAATEAVLLCTPAHNVERIFRGSRLPLPRLDGPILDALPERMPKARVLDLGAGDAFWAQECLARGADFVQAVMVEKEHPEADREAMAVNWVPTLHYGLIDQSRLTISSVALNGLSSASAVSFSHCLVMDQLNSSADPLALLQFAAKSCTDFLIVECAVSDGWATDDAPPESLARLPRNWCDSADSRPATPGWLPSTAWLRDTLSGLGFVTVSLVPRHPLPAPRGSGRILLKAEKRRVPQL
jgi:hypothetical protein